MSKSVKKPEQVFEAYQKACPVFLKLGKFRRLEAKEKNESLYYINMTIYQTPEIKSLGCNKPMSKFKV